MKTFAVSVKIFLLFTLLTGIIYPLLITGIAQIAFPSKANGSLIYKDNRLIGSKLIAQQSDSNIYFSSRPSAVLYNPLPSGASNLGMTNDKLKTMVNDRKKLFMMHNLIDSTKTIPSEILFASASGLDPHISPQAAYLQLDRIAKARHFNAVQKQKLYAIIQQQIEKPWFFLLGELRVNVLLLNLKVDEMDLHKQ